MTSYVAPIDAQTYLMQVRAGTYVMPKEGSGIVEQHLPCPVCAAPEWRVVAVDRIMGALSVPAMCKQCSASSVQNMAWLSDRTLPRFFTTNAPDMTNMPWLASVISTDHPNAAMNNDDEPSDEPSDPT